MKISELDRFWSKVNKDGECWEWQGAKRGGYGLFSTKQQNNQHRNGPNADNKSSGVLGVQPTPAGRWVGAVNHGGKSFNAGTHDTIAEAEAAVIALRLQIFTHNDKDRIRLSAARQAAQDERKARIWSCIDELKASVA